MRNDNIPPGETKENKLEIYTLGRFQVCCGGEKLFAETGRSRKTGELFMYLVTHRWKTSAPEVILESLWPEQEYTDPRGAFKLMIHRLKQKLNAHQVPGTGDFVTCSYGCYGWNNSVSCWLDAEVFETLCREARSLAETDPLRATAKYRQALDLYRGDYLPLWHHSDWVLPARQYYRRLFVRSVSELLALQKEHRLFSQMAEDCERALFIEQLEESVHLRYLEALLGEGKVDQARAHYEHITALLYQQLGVRPSSAMRRVYRAIKKESEKPELDFTDVQQILRERDSSDGALLCEPEMFRLLCRLERRRAERQHQSVQLGLFTFTGPDFQPLPPAPLRKAMDGLQGVLLANLRRGDAIASLNENQFALLLPGLELKQVQGVLERVKERFKETGPPAEVVLRSSAHPVLPWE